MRKIKFRAWDKERKEFQFTKETEAKYECGFTVESFDDGYGNKDFVWMQFTGLLDKNGKEICEGDLVRIIYPDATKDDYSVGEVVYSEFKFELRINPTCCFQFSDFSMKYCEVIGNIYENPELLGKEK